VGLSFVNGFHERLDESLFRRDDDLLLNLFWKLDTILGHWDGFWGSLKLSAKCACDEA
jgi:hypothetical protein